MNTDQLITRSIHAIRTNQPRLAHLYMRNALQQVDANRKQLNPRAWNARKQREAWKEIGNAFQEIGKAWTGIFEQLADALSPVRNTSDKKSNYALVAGPPK